jgi:hypothetical protein
MGWSHRRDLRKKVFIAQAPAPKEEDDDDDDDEDDKPFKLSDYDTLDTFDKVIAGSSEPKMEARLEGESTAGIRRRRKKAMSGEGYA